jgi:hypothetical protein
MPSTPVEADLTGVPLAPSKDMPTTASPSHVSPMENGAKPAVEPYPVRLDAVTSGRVTFVGARVVQVI